MGTHTDRKIRCLGHNSANLRGGSEDKRQSWLYGRAIAISLVATQPLRGRGMGLVGSFGFPPFFLCRVDLTDTICYLVGTKA